MGGSVTLRELSDFKGVELVRRILALVDRTRPLHVSLVGGDPLVRYREMEEVIPQIIARGTHVQLVTSAFRPLPASWSHRPKLNVVVSIDGLAPEHDVRRAPATYDRILQNIAGQSVTVHCTITGQMMRQDGYLEKFAAFWDANPDVKRIWFSMFTPQRGASHEEILTPDERRRAIEDLLRIRTLNRKVEMNERMIREFATPPDSPAHCAFALTTETVSADLTTPVTPCQLGGDPDCSQCGCIASIGLAVVRNYKIGGILPVQAILDTSTRVGRWISPRPAAPEPAFRILPD